MKRFRIKIFGGELVWRRGAAVTDAERQLHFLVEGVTDYAIYMLDPNGVVVTWNAGAQRIKGYEAGEIIGGHYSRFFTEEDRAAGLPGQILEKARVEGRFEGESVRIRKDGRRFYAHAIVNALRDQRGNLIGFAKITRDITKQVEAREDLRRLQEQLAQSQKMEALGQLTGGMAHDFNNTLAIIISAFQLGQRALRRGDLSKASNQLESGLDGARRAAELIRRLLAFARQQPLSPKPLDANSLVQNMSEILRRTLGINIELESVLAGGLWPIYADQNQLENALVNLATNAKDAMPAGGKLTIETSNAHLDDRYSRQHIDVPPGQYVLIAVTDTGVGMTHDQIAKCFEPFFTTKGAGEGTGLGLAQVYGFTKQSGGHARIYSETGQGTTVKLYLPRHFGQVDQQAPRQSKPVPLGRAQEVILVVEDEARVRQLAAEGLRELGYTVLEADGAKQALDVLESTSDVALLFTDVVMPQVNGRQLADEALKRWPRLKVLFTTGFSRNAIIHRGILDPGTHFIPKPFTLEDLARKVHEVLADGT
jgi:PAS domain S-box-containing protein